MTALVQAIANLSLASANHETETLQMLAALCGAGILVSMLFGSIGLDLGAEFF